MNGLIFVGIFAALILIGSLLFFKYIVSKKIVYQKSIYYNESISIGNMNPRNRESGILTMIRDAIQLFWIIDYEKLIKRIGGASTLYLCFEREMTIFLLLYFLIQILVMSITGVYWDITMNTLVQKIFGQSKDSHLSSWGLTTFHMAIYNLLFIRFLLRVRRLLYEFRRQRVTRPSKPTQKDLAHWLQMRTLEIRRALSQDFPGHSLQKIIRKIIKSQGINGSLLILKPVPSLSSIAELDEDIDFMVDSFKEMRIRKCSNIMHQYL